MRTFILYENKRGAYEELEIISIVFEDSFYTLDPMGSNVHCCVGDVA